MLPDEDKMRGQLISELEELRTTQDYLGSLLRYANAPIIVWDTAQRITIFNTAFERLTGYMAGEVMGQPLSILFPEASRDESLTKIRQASSGKYWESVEIPILCKDGETRTALWNSANIYDKDGKTLLATIAQGQDITERKQAEEVLRLFSHCVESSVDGVAMGNLNGKITYVNKEFVRMFGYSKEELIGKDIAFIYSEHQIPKLKEAIKATIEGGWTGELIGKRKDGELFPIAVVASRVVDDKGNVIAQMANHRDVTERYRKEERETRLQQELYLSSRLAAIGELATGVAHEINNPLTGILGFSQLLLRKSEDEETRTDLARIYNEAQRVAKIVQNLLTFARRHESKKKYADVNDIMQKALELRAYELKTSNIEVALDLAPGPPKVMADFQQLEEVFLNIILNAEQAMVEAHNGGKLSIKTQEIKDNIRVCFTDDGPGIAAEHFNKLFDPFFTTRDESGGTGLGLSVCHGIVAEHGGRVYAKSKPGKGATFVVELPLTT